MLFTNATGGTWTGAGGSFIPSPDSIDIVYTPSQSEINFNFTALTFTTTGNGFCDPASDVVNVIIIPEPTADAGPDDTICINNPSITLSGSSTNANTFYWTGGLGTFSDSSSLITSYTPSDVELSLKTPITLTLHVNQDNT